MVIIRLSRGGSKNRPFYHIVVADSRKARDGRRIEVIGHYNPISKNKDDFTLKTERLTYWLSQGAQPSDRVSSLIKRLPKAA